MVSESPVGVVLMPSVPVSVLHAASSEHTANAMTNTFNMPFFISLRKVFLTTN